MRDLVAQPYFGHNAPPWPKPSIKCIALSAAAFSSRRSSRRCRHCCSRCCWPAFASRRGDRRSRRRGRRSLLAWLVWGMPLSLTVAAATHGMAFGLWPISWIVLSAVFFYNLSVESGDFDVIRRSLARADRRSPRPGAARRVLLRRAHRRHRRIRRAGGDYGVDARRTRLRADHGGRARAHRQHGAGRVWIARHSGHDAGRPARADAGPRHADARRTRCRRWSAVSCRSSRW